MADRLKVHIFYSWQTDLPNSVNRGFIERALEKAATSLKGEADLEIEPVVDRDTKGVPGAPDIAVTILEKIDNSHIVVADVSIINKGTNERLVPNPNVVFELGYAVKVLGWRRLVLVFNTEFGDPTDLPFDLRMKRLTTYQLAPGTSDKSSPRVDLAKKLEIAIREVVLDLKRSATSKQQFATADFDFESDTRVTRYQLISPRYFHEKKERGSYAIHSLTIERVSIPEARLQQIFYNSSFHIGPRPERHPAGYTQRNEMLAITRFEDGHIVSEGYLKLEKGASSDFLPPWFVSDLHRHLQLSKEVFQGFVQRFVCIVTFSHIESFTWVFPGSSRWGVPYAGYHFPIKELVEMESIPGRDEPNKVAEPTKRILHEVGKIFGLSELPQAYWNKEGLLLRL